MTTLNARIRRFYDRSTPLWLEVWGEHLHHGYYGADGSARPEPRQAQADLVSELVRWGGVRHARRVLDAGCGVGGSARYLASQFGASVLGVTLSPVQAAQATRYTEEAGLQQQVEVQVRDMMEVSEADGPFGLVWSLESAEHIADKAELFRLFHRVLTPGGQLVMATWCHRLTPPELTRREQRLLERIYRLYHLPPMVPRETLEAMAQAAGFRDVRTEDWSRSVAPFWMAVLRSAVNLRSIIGLFRAGWPTLKGAWAMLYMIRGYRMGLIRFAVLKGGKGG
ncbi:MAG: methyltransferase domain-containing protein [Bacteroidia bacterium]|nr:methyltransferase domain-containing protein [Bacteroidia bacterium]